MGKLLFSDLFGFVVIIKLYQIFGCFPFFFYFYFIELTLISYATNERLAHRGYYGISTAHKSL